MDAPPTCFGHETNRLGKARAALAGRVAAGVLGLLLAAGCAAAADTGGGPVTIARQGSFEAGGKVIGDPGKSLSCDHGHVEYEIPVNPKAVPLMLWHSSSAAVWDRRWDGGEGYKTIFLRRGFPIYTWDGPRVGRANFGCEAYEYKPVPGRDEGSFIAWRFGVKYKEWFPGLQFPTGDAEAWNQAVRARYDEFDNLGNVQLQSDAAAKALDRIGPTVLVTNSAGGLRAMVTALKTKNVAAIVAYESPGYVFPKGEGPQLEPGPFGPVYVSAEEFDKLTKFPIQIVWGDNVDKFDNWRESYRLSAEFVKIVNAHGGRAEILRLPDAGLRGNSHIPFTDLNNVAVADQLSAFLQKHGLDKPASASAR